MSKIPPATPAQVDQFVAQFLSDLAKHHGISEDEAAETIARSLRLKVTFSEALRANQTGQPSTFLDSVSSDL